MNPQTTKQIINDIVTRAARELNPLAQGGFLAADAQVILRACVELIEQGGVEGALQNLSGYRRVSNSGIGPGLVPQDHDDIQAALQFYAALKSAAGETKKEGV